MSDDLLKIANPVFWVTHRTAIPPWIAHAVGKIVTEYSYLEWQFEEVIRLLLETDIKRARIVSTGMNMRTRTAVAATLARAHGKGFTSEIQSLGNEARELQTEREKLAHGLWAKMGKGWCLVRTSGIRRIGGVKIARAFLPTSERITRGGIADIRSRIRNTQRRMRLLRKKLKAALPPSPHKSPEQFRQTNRPLRHTKTV